MKVLVGIYGYMRVAEASWNGRSDLSVPVSFGYYMVRAKTAVNQRRNIAFREWLIAEARDYEANRRL